MKELMESEEPDYVTLQKPRKLIDQKQKVTIKVLLYDKLKGMRSTDQTG